MQVIEFTEQFDFVRALLDMGNAPVDGLVAAVIRHGYQLRKLDRDWLVQVRPPAQCLSKGRLRPLEESFWGRFIHDLPNPA
jgi:hypothetical protein